MITIIIFMIKTRTLYERSTIVRTSPDQGNRVRADLAHPVAVVFIRSQLTNHPRTLHITFKNQPNCGSNRGANGAHSVADAVLPVAVLHLEELDQRVGHLESR